MWGGGRQRRGRGRGDLPGHRGAIVMLTDADCRAAKPQAKRYELDADGAGLRLRVTPNGVRVWTLRYRNAAGEQRRAKLGVYPDIKLGEARKRAATARDRIRNGEDPNADKEAAREALRMVDLFGRDDEQPGWYLKTYVTTAGKLGTAKTDKGIANDRSYISKHLRLRAALMRKRVDEVTLGELNRIKAATTPSTWRKVRNILIVGFRHAEEIGAIAPGSNPALRTNAAMDAKRERYLTPDERARLDAALGRAEEIGPAMKGVARGEAGGLSSHLVRVVRLLALTGMRRGEVLALRWEHIDWRHHQLRLPTSKTGARDVPLSPQAIAYLRAEQQRDGATRVVGLVCCTSEGHPIHPENVSRAWHSIRTAAGLGALRLHDLRHSFASDAVSAGVPLYVVGKALGHSQPNTTARYSHLHDAAIREGLAKAGAAIQSATDSGDATLPGVVVSVAAGRKGGPGSKPKRG